ncbi:hypothetical protein DUGA2_64320 [Duganella sp. HH101]|nr:hypothetical protein DUGA2_64320 [Duganella sp. HH101]
MSAIGATLSSEDAQYVNQRIHKLSYDYDAPGLWHDFKAGVDNVLGMDPLPVRTPELEAERSALLGIGQQYGRANPEAIWSTAALVGAAADGQIGAAAVIATQNTNLATRINVAQHAAALDQVAFAFGSAGAARANLSTLRYQGTQNTIEVTEPTGGYERTISARNQYMGSTPDKYSRTGREVVERMRSEGLIIGDGPLLRGNPNDLHLVNPNGTTVRIGANVDMAHQIDAVTWWNQTGRFYGPKSPEVRQFMLDPNNYMLQLGSTNSAAGARLGETYLPPAPGFDNLKR